MRPKLFLFIVTFFSTCTQTFARAGGGFSGGRGFGGGGYRSYGYGYGHHYHYYGSHPDDAPWYAYLIIGIVTTVFIGTAFFGFAILMRRSSRRAKNKLEAAKKFDSLWDEKKMEAHVREIFPRIQSAWMSRELKDVSDIVTLRFIGRFQPLLNDYKRRRIMNVIDQVSLEQVKIVDIHDDADNSKDAFAAYLKGSMRDYLMHESAGLAGAISDAGTKKFEDLYIFKRKDSRWLLHHIVNDPETADFKLKQYGF